MNRDAFVALPGISIPTVVANLPSIVNGRQPPPVIFMDHYDWERLWGQVVMERDHKAQMEGLLCDDLRRRGVIQTIDYAEAYPAENQKENIQRYRQALRSVPDHVIQQAAGKAVDGFLNFCYGEYQQSLREALGDWRPMHDRVGAIEHQQDKMERGVGRPIRWNDRVFCQYITALEVRNAIQRKSQFDSIGVIGQGEREAISTVLHSAAVDFDGLSLRPEDHAIEQIDRPNLDQTEFEREVLNSVTEVAQELAGTQDEGWFILGSHLAVPNMPRVFMRAWHADFEQDTASLAAETDAVLDRLDKEAEENRSKQHIEAASEAIAEEHGMVSQEQIREVQTQLSSAVDLTNYARDLREFSDSTGYSDAAIFTAATMRMDPQHQYSNNETYHRAVDMQNRLRQLTVRQDEIQYFSNRGSFRRGGDGKGWYQRAERQRRWT